MILPEQLDFGRQKLDIQIEGRRTGLFMELTASNLAELVKALRSSLAPTEKRKHPRVGLRARAGAIINGVTLPVWIRDVSTGGVNISCPQKLAIGAEIDLLLSDSHKIKCQVCNCRQSAQNSFSIGVRFTQDVVVSPKNA
jgi:PilZ domain